MTENNEMTENKVRPYSFIATTGLACGLLGQILLIIIVGAVIYTLLYGKPDKVEDGALSIALTLGAEIISLAIIWLLVYKRGGFRTYLALDVLPNWRQVGKITLWLAIFLGIVELFSVYIWEIPLSDWQKDFFVWQLSPLAIFNIIAVILLTPWWEELFFRGFLFRGWHTQLFGNWGAIILGNLLWTIIHLQYNWQELIMVFAFGLFLGAVRIYTGSMWLAIYAHCLSNLVALVITYYSCNS